MGDCDKNPEECATKEETYKFKWHQEVAQFGDKLLQRLDEFRKKNVFYDVTLRTTDEALTAHKVVLAACGGMFRSHFIDPKTKQILSNVTEVYLPCDAAGLRPILKFAYSGVLEITEENLLPVFLASDVTDLKEVLNICADIAITRFGWILDFNGSPETIPLLNRDGRTTDKAEEAIQLTIEETWWIVKQLLELNSVCFGTDCKIHSDNAILKLDETSPHLDQIAARFPQHVTTYKAIIKCLRKAQEIISPDSQHHNEISVTKTSDKKPKHDELQANDHGANNLPICAGAVQIPDDDKKAPESIQSKDKDPDNTALIAGEHAPDDATHNGTKDADKISNGNIVTKKPTTKPRKVSTAKSPTESEDKSLKPTKDISTSHKALKKSPAPPPSLGSEANPTPPRKKNPAPKPPGPPLGKAQSNDPPSKPVVAARTPEYKAKQPPPRPKPPSFKKNEPSKSAESRTPSQSYDDSLNPFAIDDDDEDAADPEPGDDDSLNPFC